MNSKGNTMYLKFSNYKNEFRSEIQQNYRKSSLLFWPSVLSGPPRQIFDRQDPHYSIVRPHPQGAAAAAASFLQNPDKTLVLDVLPPVATLDSRNNRDAFL